MSFSYSQPYIVVGALIARDNKILLVKENHPPDKGKWNIPAGKLTYGESPTEAVKREVFEETGLSFMPTAVLGLHSIHREDVPGNSKTTHVLRVVYVGQAEGTTNNDHGEVVDSEPEIAEYAWLKPEEILAVDNNKLRYHDIKNYVRDYLSGKSYPLDLITHLVQLPANA